VRLDCFLKLEWAKEKNDNKLVFNILWIYNLWRNNYCAWSCDMGKISVYRPITFIGNLKEIWRSKAFCMTFDLKRELGIALNTNWWNMESWHHDIYLTQVAVSLITTSQTTCRPRSRSYSSVEYFYQFMATYMIIYRVIGGKPGHLSTFIYLQNALCALCWK